MNLSKYLYTVTIFIFLFEIYVLLKIVTITTAPIWRGVLEISKFWHYLNHFLVSSYFFGLHIGCRTRVFSFAVAFK